MATLTYIDDLSPLEAWQMLESDASAVLIDVRTQAEWSFVGVVDLRDLGREALYNPWVLPTILPKMERNPHFVEHLETALGEPSERPLLFLCRSGHRSAYAADAMTARGFSECYNIQYGFEGDKDSDNHRGVKNGWKFDGLPWLQS